MASQLRTIYTNLADQVVSFTRENGTAAAIGARDLHELKNAVQAADAPVRLLLPFSVYTEGREGQFASLDSVNRQDWYIVDLLLYKNAPLGASIADIAPDIIRYQAAYLDMLRGFRDCVIVGGGSDVELLGWRVLPGVFRWPVDSLDEGARWYAVMVTLQVMEIVTG